MIRRDIVSHESTQRPSSNSASSSFCRKAISGVLKGCETHDRKGVYTVAK
jgi:hypothetical protein